MPSLSSTPPSKQSNTQTANLAPLEKIILGRKYFISSWVEAGYADFVLMKKISDSDMEAIGAVESFKLMRIIRDLGTPTTFGPFSGLSVLLAFEAVRMMKEDSVIKKEFEAELQSIVAAEFAYT
jgi:hypothetical protein